MIGVSFFFTATAPDDAWATSTLVLLQSVTLCVALWTSGLARAGSLLNIAFLSVAVLVAVARPLPDQLDLTGLLALLSGLLTLAIVVVIALSIVDQGEINPQSITGAICIYILLGMIFLFVYGAAASFGHGAFFAQGTDGTRALRLYFSYVTLATLGYGDYTPQATSVTPWRSSRRCSASSTSSRWSPCWSRGCAHGACSTSSRR